MNDLLDVCPICGSADAIRSKYCPKCGFLLSNNGILPFETLKNQSGICSACDPSPGCRCDCLHCKQTPPVFEKPIPAPEPKFCSITDCISETIKNVIIGIIIFALLTIFLLLTGVRI
jgi:hypothetical protein